MIRTLQDHGIHQGITVHMEWTIVRLLKDGNRVVGAFGYDRERGRFKIFKAKAVVIASGGLGRAYKITSNSWEGTGDGHSLAYHAGAELMDMEFVQFHPTGMIWPPSVQGLLVTESVRGEGGVLRNKDGKRFMYDDIPDNYKSQTSTDPEEGWRYTQNDKTARRPPELLTRDHVPRCINREVKAGRGSPHGGVFLDISWIKEKIPNAPEHIKKKLPSMYHQFMQLANLDITKEPMEIGPTVHYVMGGVQVNGDNQMSSVPGLFAAGECAAGLHGANRLGGNFLFDLLVFGKRAGEYAAKYAKENPAGQISEAQIEEAARQALEPFEHGASAGGSAEGPYQVQHELQNMMQELVGIVRREDEMSRALENLGTLRDRAAKAAVYGHREYNPGWHTALDLKHLLTVAEAIALSALDRKESRGGHFREDFPDKSAEAAKVNTVVSKAADGSMKLRREPIPAMPPELKQVIDEMSTVTFRIWRSGEEGQPGKLVDYQTEASEGMVVLDVVHKIQATQANDLACRWNCKAGKCGSCSAEINGMPRLMCMTRLDMIPIDKPVTVEPMRAFPGLRDLVTDVSWNFRVKKKIKKFKPRAPDAPDGTWRMQQADVDRVQEFRKCIECFLCQDVCHVLRDHHKQDAFIGPRYFVYTAALEMHPLDTEDRLPELKKSQGVGYCNITKCCTKVCPEHITITDNAIIPLKERVVDEFYDPLGWLWKKLRPKA